MTASRHPDFKLLLNAGYMLLALQIAVFAKMCLDLGVDRASDNFPIIIVCGALFVVHARRLAWHPPDRGAGRWLFASRVAMLVFLALATLGIAYSRLASEVRLPGDLVLRSLFALMWVIIGLKGAAMGKIKPGSAGGLCVSWTRSSRLAWERGHRALGRVLFWGGSIGLIISLIVHPLWSIGMWCITVLAALVSALLVSWRAWRTDPAARRPS